MKTPLETTMNGYDTIVAVTQNNINANLRFLYGTKGGIEPKIRLSDDKHEEGIEAEIDAPTVRLNVAKEPGKVIFQLKLKRGTLTYWKGRGRSAQLQTQPIQDWLIGFKVDLDMTDMDARDIPKDIQDTLRPLTPAGAIDPGVFSVRQLFLNFENAFLAGLDRSSTAFPPDVADPGSRNRLKDADLDFVFFKFLQNYLQARRKDGNILGYAIYTRNPNAIAGIDPTFPPTSVTYATNLFLPDGREKPDSSSYAAAPGDEPGGLDTLNFLMMTNHRAWPSPERPGPAWFGNWVADKDHYGTVAIASHLFVDDFLLPTLAAMTAFTTSFSFRDVSAGLSVSYRMDVPTAPNPEGRYRPHPSTPGRYTYDSGRSAKTLKVNGAGYAQDHHWSAQHTASIEIQHGGNAADQAGRAARVQVRGTSLLRCDVTHWTGFRDVAGTPTLFWRQGKATWEFSVTLSSVTTGGLHADVSDVTITTETSQDGDWLYHLVEWLSRLFHGQLDNFCSGIRTTLTRLIKGENLQRRVQNNLNGYGMFVFPGGQQFKMSDPVFNDELDLLVNTQYEFY